jgi:hypothetical protein
MSDYFGALLRMSGITVGAGAPAAVARLAAPSIEAAIHAERSAPAEQPQSVQGTETRAKQPSRQPAGDTAGAAPILPQNAEVAPMPVHPEASLMDTPSLRAERDGAVQAQADTAIKPDAAPVPSLPKTAERTAAAADPPLGRALVHAAMRWVAAGPQQAAHPAERAIPRGQAASIAAKVDGAVVDRTAHDTTVELDTGRPRAFPVRELEVAQASAPRPAIAATPMASAALLAVRDEIVDVSIGSIHVRVDAPGPQTVARAAVPSPAAAPRTTGAPVPARSSLSRRAMRRI